MSLDLCGRCNGIVDNTSEPDGEMCVECQGCGQAYCEEHSERYVYSIARTKDARKAMKRQKTDKEEDTKEDDEYNFDEEYKYGDMCWKCDPTMEFYHSMKAAKQGIAALLKFFTDDAPDKEACELVEKVKAAVNVHRKAEEEKKKKRKRVVD